MDMLDDYLTLENLQLEIRFQEGEHRFALEAFDTLKKALPSISHYFLLSRPFPKVRAVLVTNRNEFDRLVRDLLHVEIEVPSNPARIAQPQRTDMMVLSPSAYEGHSIFKYIPDDFRRMLIHELVHMMEEHLSPDMEAIPRWWSEGLGVYLSEQWRYEDEFRKPAFDGIERKRIPGFHRIEAERRLAYDWGWTIVRFVEVVYGRNMILRVVKECADGNVFSVIGEQAVSLENRWRDWLLAEGLQTGQSG